MTIGFAPKLSVEVTKHSSAINLLVNDLQNLIRDKDYGEDISELYIGIVCVNPQFAQFFKPQLPKYTKGKKSYIKDDINYKHYNSFEYEIQLDFELFKNATELEAQKMISKSLLLSFDAFKKFKNFNCDQFKSDLEGLFKSKNLL